jgi:hypothetical protein
MPIQNFDKQKVQVVYKITYNFTADPTVAAYDKKKGGTPAADLIRTIKGKANEFNFVGELKDGKLDKITKISFPTFNNSHMEAEGWAWQLDVKEVGSGSKSRLVLACKPSTHVTIAQKESGTVKVGKEDYKKIEATITLRGKFRAIANSK